MNNYSSYYLYQKYETRSGSTTIPCYPATYSLDGDGTMPLVVKQADDPQCGATPVQYRWVNMDVSTNYICNGFDKYYKQKKQQSVNGGSTWTDVVPAEYRRGDLYQPNSQDCGYVPIQYRWTNMDVTSYYICDGYDKYYQQKRQQSTDGGSTWTDVVPAEYRRGDLYETNSQDCGYVPPTPTGSKFHAVYSNSRLYDVVCNGSSTLTSGETKYNTSAPTYTAMTDAVIGDCVETIGDGALQNCISLSSVTIPNSVTSIDYQAFMGCSGLTSVTIPDSVTSISNSAFTFCTSLTSMTIPSSVTIISQCTFQGCDSLQTVTIPNTITAIKNSSFQDCISLLSVTIPDSVTLLEGRAFENCSSLTSVTISNSVASIGGGDFYGCSGLTSVTIPNSVTSIGSSAFRECISLTSITIPNSVTNIGGRAFHHCSGLTSVSIGNSVTNIGQEAFRDCSRLTYITIPNSVTSIGVKAFGSCTGLTSVSIGNSVRNIGERAFSYCSGLTSVTIPSTIKSIGEAAFWVCPSLTSITVLATTPPTLGNNAFYTTSGYLIYVPAQSVSAYRCASGWSNYASKIRAIP